MDTLIVSSTGMEQDIGVFHVRVSTKLDIEENTLIGVVRFSVVIVPKRPVRVKGLPQVETEPVHIATNNFFTPARQRVVRAGLLRGV